MKPADDIGIGRHRRPARRRSGRLRWALGIVLALLLVWMGSFGWFLNLIATEHAQNPMPHADGIVVLTGGAERVKAGLELLMAGAAPRLLISGAGEGTFLGDFTVRDGIDANSKAADIDIGHSAASTKGNARETAAWAKRYHVASLIVVTADYHMPRAMIDLQRAMPDVRLVPEPVRPPAMTHPSQPHILKILMAEFIKYIAVRLHLDGIAAHRIEAHG
ncbi:MULTISPECIES: YdcF family protein [unclassified Acidiphilium]|uniref:YdcF family protein n=1 Tax=unclassified Acidiphilium TaxID=2617493 RepID=UPI000BDC6015|nr:MULTISPECIES: YdcF family protein [unclassified Acidiphilium]OYV56317.1 MAG: hypothetical protein B7Z76_06830 [Acidiphilium sp. 20-67-58]HQT61114.1 YdcF family protein [Acidiphilium sp.]